MSKPKSNKDHSPFERFQNFTKALVAIPRAELQQKLDEYERQKKHKKSRRSK